MMQPASPTSDRRVPPWVAILVLVVLIAIVVAGLWYFMGGGGSRTVVTDPAFEPGGVMTNEWLYSPNTSGIRRTDPKQPDQWRIKSGNTWVDVARVDGKLRFRINDRRGWGRGSSVMTREQGDVLRMAGQIAGNPSRFRYLNLTQQQVDTLKAQGGSVTSDLPADSTAALAEAWPKFEAASGRSK